MVFHPVDGIFLCLQPVQTHVFGDRHGQGFHAPVSIKRIPPVPEFHEYFLDDILCVLPVIQYPFGKPEEFIL
jgi:hypothetical protein